ncbi:hypothetical protein HWQ46_26790 [Shewanella sp. D64]|uniref:hypothetical protein n=1 Tax=unclassified Shewanella TaxID=196818 RepID=UPI0022BA1735|nr:MULTISPECIES: hypothetical protein [unclassified Shewanella]MEC4729115.1 hypothetical protein [Shewanella sp. D64]MEC4740924.1 hypothetical protein [Shewanella sp. E94]WBJ93550.1 hypothetical protein HWQ47_16640 [Shewanella sp. MTB7]
MKNPEFNHLLKHYRHHKLALRYAMAIYRTERSTDSAFNMAAARGALDCLYAQAAGKGLINFAKGIRRTIEAAARYASAP